MDAVNTAKAIGEKVKDVQLALIDRMSPAMRELLEQDAAFAALPEDQRVGAAKVQVATMILATTIAVMREAGCTAEMIDDAVANARAIETKNAKAGSPS